MRLKYTMSNSLTKKGVRILVMPYGVSRHYQQYFSYIVVVNFIVGETRVPGDIQRPAARH